MAEEQANQVAKITRLGPSVAAPEWALRQAMDIADRHSGDCSDAAAWQRRAELGRDIAEALFAVAAPIMGGRGKSCDACYGSGLDVTALKKP